jgi:hypothetical protein
LIQTELERLLALAPDFSNFDCDVFSTFTSNSP